MVVSTTIHGMQLLPGGLLAFVFYAYFKCLLCIVGISFVCDVELVVTVGREGMAVAGGGHTIQNVINGE